ncbi:T9SS type A sorting domain-containing protein [Bacteroidales bacterium OttesenSCG-928-B11]|nr:T9SS type A sorting domain-containing protein [Bacteroidales bacterium OttesenSCG-928-C03]MDL2311375.1 T9SS type A sorting domain-containing protein [Bacteroidales bacterium OttesenSCG-928-B11]MDL2326011.1 T9SS type A sorting domain-containing protein [Bacteroidales bacterium OttesenSCG-928-A14]
MKKYYFSINRKFSFIFFACCLFSASHIFAQTNALQTVSNDTTFVAALGGFENADCESIADDEFRITLKNNVILTNPIEIVSGKYHLSTLETRILVFNGNDVFITVAAGASLQLGSENENNQLIIQGIDSLTVSSAFVNSGSLSLLSSLTINNFNSQDAIIKNRGSNATLTISPAVELQDGGIIRIVGDNQITLTTLPTNDQRFNIQLDSLHFCHSHITIDQEDAILTEAILSSFNFLIPDTLLPYLTETGDGIAIFKPVLKNDVTECYAYYSPNLDSTFTESTLFYEYNTENCQNLFINKITIKNEHSLEENTVTLVDTICESERPYFVGDSALYTSGNHKIILTNSWGCDSTILLDLTIRAIAHIHDTISVCPSSLPYLYRGDYYFVSGDYDISLHSSGSCDTMIKLHFTVFQQPDVTISGNSNACIGSSIQLTANGNDIISYEWSNGSNDANINVTVSGGYSVTATDKNGCVASDLKTVAFTPNPNAVISYNLSYDSFDSVQLTANGIGSYLWSTHETTAQITIFEEGTYSVTISSGEFCSSSDTVTIIDKRPKLEISKDQRICIGDSIVLTARDSSSSSTGFIWSTGAQTASIKVSPTTTGLFHVTATTSEGFFKTATVEVTVIDTAAYQIIGRPYICVNEAPALSISGVADCIWNNGKTTETIEITQAGWYSVTFSVMDGCTGHDSILVEAKPKPTVTIDALGETTFCEGRSVMLHANGGVDYLWSNGAETQVISATESGRYIVTATDAYGCSDTASIVINVKPGPIVEFSAPETSCIGQQIIIEAIGSPAYSYNWNPGNITTSYLTANPTATGTSSYFVTVTASNGCTKERRFNVAVFDFPEVLIYSKNEFCQGDTITISAVGANSYEWDTGETGSEIEVSAGRVYQVTATGEGGCKKTFAHQVIQLPSPNAAISGNSSFCQGGEITLMATGGDRFAWNTLVTTQVITVTQPGTYTVTVTSSNGCSKTASKEVNTIPAPAIQISGNRNFCANTPHTIRVIGDTNYIYNWSTGENSDSIIISTGGTYTVSATNSLNCTSTVSATFSTWEVPSPVISGEDSYCEGDESFLSVSSPADLTFLWSNGSTEAYIRPVATGTYIVTATNTKGCSGTTSKNVVFNAKPSIVISGKSELCLGESTMLTASEGNQYSYAWNVPGENSRNITVTPTATTTYTVDVTNRHGCFASKSVTVLVNPIPTPSITGSQTLCVGSTMILTAHGGATYRWNTGQVNSSISIYKAGTYSVTATTAKGCTASVSHLVTEKALPTVAIIGDSSICYTSSTTWTATGGTSYVWSTSSTAPSITVSQAINYSVTATNEFGCQSSASRKLTVNSLPEFSINGESSFCAGRNLTLTVDGDAGLSYEWMNGTTGHAATISESGTYSVTATNANGCTRVKSKSVFKNPSPTASIIGAGTVCPGDSITLLASGGISYIWSNGSNTASNIVTPLSAITYWVTVSNEYDCTATASKSISINPTPNVTFSGNTSFCTGGSTEITAHGGTSFLWSDSNINAVNLITTPGTYTVTATNGLGCRQSASIHITENPVPDVHISGSTVICEGSIAILSATGGDTYSWSTGENSASINVSPIQSWIYTVTATNEYNCTSTAQHTLTVNPLPDVTISGSSQGCQGDTVTLTAFGGGTYNWNTGEQTAMNNVTEQGTYIVTVTNEYGCSVMESRIVIFMPKPAASISGNTSFCDGEYSTLTASGGMSYLWNDGTNNAAIDVYESGSYSVTVSNSNGCASTASVTVTMLAAPQIIISGNRTICEGESTTLYATGGVTYAWSDGGESNSLAASPTQTTIYSVTATNHLDCTSSMDIEIVVHPAYSFSFVDEICIGNGYRKYGFDLPIQDSTGVFKHELPLTTAHGCDSTIMLTLTVKPKPIMTEAITGNASISIAGNYTYMINNAQHANAYQWSITNPNWNLIPTTNKNAVLEIHKQGSGTLSVLAVNDCGLSETRSISIQALFTSIDTYELDATLSIFPNPASEYIIIKNENPFTVHAEIYDLNGKLIITSNTIESEAQISLHDLAPGNYFVRILGENNTLGTKKIVKM